MSTDQWKRVNEAWKKNIREAIARFCERQKIKIDALGRTLGIDQDAWYDLSRGRRIIKTVEYYAVLYRETKIPETDPRQLPPDEYGKVRAWTDSYWRNWLDNPVVPGKKDVSQTVSPTKSAKVLSVQKSNPTNRTFTLSELKSLPFIELVSMLQGQQSPKDIRLLADELRSLILSQGKTTSQRDEIVRKYGDVLHDLNNLLDAYEQTPKLRDNILLLKEASDGKFGG